MYGWYDLLAIRLDKLALVASDVVDMHLAEAKVEEALDMGAMLIQVRRHENAALEVLGAHELAEGGEIFRRANVLLWCLNAAVGPFLHRLLLRLLVAIGPGDVQLQQFGHRRGIFPGLTRALFEVLDQRLELLRRRGGRNQTIAHAPGGLVGFGTGGGDVDRRGLLRTCVEARARHAQVLPGIAHLFASEEPLNDLD